MHKIAKRLMLGIVPVLAAVALTAESTPTIKIRDDCQPATFNQPPPDGAGPGTCAADFSGNTSFPKLIEQLTKHQDAPLWRFTPSNREVDAGTQLSLDNYGGETHTFTRVQAYGGGFVLPLNQLSGTPIPAPECLATSVAGTFVPAGAEDQKGPVLQNADRGTTVKFQCCIHPWMRSEIKVR
jgi:plastocyanin